MRSLVITVILVLTVVVMGWIGLEGYNKVVRFAEAVKNEREMR